MKSLLVLAACVALAATKAEAAGHAPKLNYEIFKTFDMGASGFAGGYQMPGKRLAVPYQFAFCNVWKDGYCDGRDQWELQDTLEFNITSYDPDHPEGWTEPLILDDITIRNQVDASGTRHGRVDWRPKNHFHPDQYLDGRMGGTITYKNEFEETDGPCDYEDQVCIPGKLCEPVVKKGQMHSWSEFERAYFSVDFFQPTEGNAEEDVAHMDFQISRLLRSESTACGPKP